MGGHRVEVGCLSIGLKDWYKSVGKVRILLGWSKPGTYFGR